MIRLAFPRPGGGKFIDPWDGIRERVGDGRDKKLVVTKRGYMEKSKKTYVLSKTSYDERIKPFFKQDTGLFTYQRSYTS